MTAKPFDGRVAVVTGAGRGIGRAYAHLLGDLGAKVVVNDLGGSKEGAGADAGPARRVADEIIELGGTAVDDSSDISTTDGGNSPIKRAVAEFGRIDVIVNNAGNIRFAGLPEVDEDNIESHLAVHVKGSFHTTRAAWPYFVEQNYGRVVHTTSIGQFGLPDNLGYAIAKSAMLGMARSMAVSTGDHDIKVNVIAPNAITRMGGQDDSDESAGMASLREERHSTPTQMDPRLVAPMVAYLAHESCSVNGETFLAGGARFAHLFVGLTEGWIPEDASTVTLDDIAMNLDQIKDRSRYAVPATLNEAVAHYMSHLGAG